MGSNAVALFGRILLMFPARHGWVRFGMRDHFFIKLRVFDCGAIPRKIFLHSRDLHLPPGWFILPVGAERAFDGLPEGARLVFLEREAGWMRPLCRLVRVD